jgi:glycosyltransferase involved in cell wall biosynthesis
MRVAHIGPPLARRGGPAGYLLQLSAAVERFGRTSPHQLTFPAAEAPTAPPRATFSDGVRSVLRPIKRALAGPPAFARPREDDLRRPDGAVNALLQASRDAVCADASAAIDAALNGGVDVLVAHEAFVAERLLELRRPGQQVWLVMHAPMPVGLDLTWSWAVPEWDWRSIVELADVARWLDWEIGVCSAVDRLITPCAEAAGELARVDRRFASLSFDYVLTGAEGRPRRFGGDRPQLRARWGLPADVPVGLFLSSPLPYRGLDVLLDAVARVPAGIPGLIAIAGSSRGVVRDHARVRRLGVVAEISDLLQAVDFVVNVNRFSLFDLSTIEAAEAGRPLLLHATGGNLRFRDLGVGCVMLENLDAPTVAAGLETMFAIPDDRRRALAEASRACYDRHLTLATFWNGHEALYAAATEHRHRPAS